MTTALAQTKFKTCFSCNYQAGTIETRCPSCGKPLQDQQTIRILGGVLMFLGLFIVGIIGSVLFWMNNVISGRGRFESRWNASPEETSLMFAILYLTLAFGLSAVFTGLWQLGTGKRNLKLIWAMLGLGLILWLLVTLITNFVV